MNQIPSPERVSKLVDMLIIHMLYRRTTKALAIAQYLRAAHGFQTELLDCATGFRNYYREDSSNVL